MEVKNSSSANFGHVQEKSVLLPLIKKKKHYLELHVFNQVLRKKIIFI